MALPIAKVLRSGTESVHSKCVLRDGWKQKSRIVTPHALNDRCACWLAFFAEKHLICFGLLFILSHAYLDIIGYSCRFC